MRSAFESLPDRWQSVLWLTCVEDADRDDVGRQLGIRPGAVSQLALRAREGLRQAYLAQYVQSSSLECERVANRLPAYIRKRTGSGESARIEEHLDGCESCAKTRVELRELNLHLGATLAVAIVGTAAAVSLVRAPAAAVAAEPRWKTNRTVRNVAVGSVVMSGLIATGAIAASINAPQQSNTAGQAVAQGAGTQAPAASDPTAATSPAQSVPTGTESTVPEASTFPVPAPSATSAAPTAGATKPAPKTTTPHPVPSLAPPTSAPTPDAFTVANPVLAASGNGTYQTRLTLPVSATRVGTRLTAALWFSGTAAAQVVGGGWKCTSSSGGSLGGTVMECKTTTTQPSADLEMLLDAALPQDFEATVRNDDSAESHAVSATLTA